MKKQDKLRVAYSKKQDDFMFHSPQGLGTLSDARWLCNNLFGALFIREMAERGYDITTMKFEIEPKQGQDKFASTRHTTPTDQAVAPDAEEPAASTLTTP